MLIIFFNIKSIKLTKWVLEGQTGEPNTITNKFWTQYKSMLRKRPEL